MIRMYSFVAFLSGAAVMIVEIAAARAIAPHFGTSIVVWTNVIGIILVALSVGYWIGGTLAERAPRAQVLGTIIAIAAVLLCIPAFATRWIAGSLLDDAIRFGSGFVVLLLGSFLSVAFLFALPVALLGMVSPFLVKLATQDRADIGAIAGQLYAISTVGSLVGTFLPTLVLLPTIGTRRTILVAALFLVIAALLLLPRRRAIIIGSGVVLLALARAPETPPPWMFGGTVVAAAESRYQYLRVVDFPSPHRATGNSDRALLFNEGFGIQSVAVRDGALPDGYFTLMGALPALVSDDPVNVLILGNAGGTIGTMIERQFPDRSFAITGVEIDPAVTAITQATFPSPPRPYVIVHADSRAFVHADATQYDLIIIDAYTNQLTIPSHLATEEFFADVRARLAPGGFIAMNVNAPSRDSRLLRTLTQTVVHAFPDVMVGHAGSSWNWIVLASNTPLPTDRADIGSLRTDFATDLVSFLRGLERVEHDDRVRPFTDDWSPLELFTDIEIFDGYRRAADQGRIENSKTENQQ